MEPAILQAKNQIPELPTFRKLLLMAGILSSLLYVVMNIIVANLYKGYDSASQTISELSAIGASTRPLWVLLGFAYTILVAIFGLGVWLSGARNRFIRITGTTLLIYGVVGLGWPLAPMHQRQVLAAGGGTLSDTMHLVFSAISVLLIFAATGFGARAFGRPFRIYSIITICLFAAFGVWTAIEAPNVQANLPTPLLGIVERILVGIFLLWIVALALILLRDQKRRNYLSIYPVRISEKKEEKIDGVLNDEKLTQFNSIIDRFLLTKRPFLKRRYSQAELAKDVGVSIHHLSAFINHYHKMNYNEFINGYRVCHSKEMIIEGEWKYKTLEGIAAESGFNNRNTFTTAFKKETGQSPSAFLNEVRKNASNYHSIKS